MRRLVGTCLTVALLLGPALVRADDEGPAAAGVFAPAGTLAEGRDTHTATALPDGRVLIIGGGAKKARFSAELWDPVSASFRPAGSLSKGRKSHTATLLSDGRVLVVGGGRAIAKAEVWDPETASFGPAGRLAEGRKSHTATLLSDGRVLVVGGWKGPSWLASAEIWDPATASFEPTGSLAEARVAHTATLLDDGRVLVVGGHGANEPAPESGIGGYPDEPRALAEVWNPVADSFSPAGSLAEARTQHTATRLPDGRVLIVGGGGPDGDIALAEVWDPATISFSPAGSLAEARFQHTATLLPDGRVLVVGGMGPDSLASAEVWDATTTTFIPAGALARGRSWHSATALPDGRVLIVGGGPGRRVSASAELWEPRVLTEEEVRDHVAAALMCNGLHASFERDFTTGDPQLDAEYLARCLTCERLEALLTYRRVADLDLGLAVHRERCDQSRPSPRPTLITGWSGVADPSPAATPVQAAPHEPLDEAGRIEMAGSGFAMTIPDDWSAELADPDPDVFSAEPGIAWEALQAVSDDRSMACSVAVGVTELPPGRWFGTGQDGVAKPYWDPKEPWRLWVPTPAIPRTRSVHMTDWQRRAQKDADLEHDVLYSLLCVADNASVDKPSRIFERLMASFELLPEKGSAASPIP